MKGSRFVLSFVVLFCFIVNPAFTFAKNYDVSDVNYFFGDYFDEVQILILSGGDSNKPSLANRSSALGISALSLSAKTVKPVSLYQNSEALKVQVTLESSVNIIITKIGNATATYKAQYVPSSSDDMIIETSTWSAGYYEVVFTSATGTILAKGTVNIH